jgi:hypothetical protein
VNRLRNLCWQPPSLLGRSGVGSVGSHGLGGYALGGHGVLRRQPRRQHEHNLRIELAAFRLWTYQRGWTLGQTAELLHLAPRTLRQWQHDLRCARLHIEALGRPRLRSSHGDRQKLLEVLHELGPATGLPTLRDAFQHMPRAELDDLLRRYRRVWRQRYHQLLRVLHWHVPGSVWAMDFAQAPHAIDGCYPYLLAVRDLASGQQLAWLPLPSADALQAIRVLEPLFVLFGAPLVLKSDNAFAFGAESMQTLLGPWGVEQLFSPPHLPSYNGSIEAGIGSLKTRTEYHATSGGRATYWTCADTEAARAEANATARPQGPTGPTPDQAWATRRPISAAERTHFRATVERLRAEARQQHDLPTDGPLQTSDARAVDRQAIRRTLEQHAFLSYSRRRYPLPFPKRKVANIT